MKANEVWEEISSILKMEDEDDRPGYMMDFIKSNIDTLESILKPIPQHEAIEAAQRLADYCLQEGGNEETVHQDLNIIENYLRK